MGRGEVSPQTKWLHRSLQGQDHSQRFMVANFAVFVSLKRNIRERKQRGVTYHMRDLAGKTDELNLLMGRLQEAGCRGEERAARAWRERAALRSRRREEDESEIKRVSAGCCSALISLQPVAEVGKVKEK